MQAFKTLCCVFLSLNQKPIKEGKAWVAVVCPIFRITPAGRKEKGKAKKTTLREVDQRVRSANFLFLLQNQAQPRGGGQTAPRRRLPRQRCCCPHPLAQKTRPQTTRQEAGGRHPSARAGAVQPSGAAKGNAATANAIWMWNSPSRTAATESCLWTWTSLLHRAAAIMIRPRAAAC